MIRAFMLTMRDLILDLDVFAYQRRFGKWACIFMPIIYPSTWPIIHYRVSRFVMLHVRIIGLRQLLRCIMFVNGRVISMMTGIEIHESAVIGHGLFIAHLGNIVIGHDTVIGKHASIHQGVTFGGHGRNTEENGFPHVGDFVYIGAGAKIVGGVVIGDHVMIGCNAVVVKDIPDNGTAVGIPAKVVNYSGSHGCVHYRGELLQETKMNDPKGTINRA